MLSLTGCQQNFIMFEKKKFSNVVDILILNAPPKRELQMSGRFIQ